MTDFVSVTEVSGSRVSREQVDRLCHRYQWAAELCRGRTVVEAACGTGQGLGYLARAARQITGGDYSGPLLEKANAHYRGRFPLVRFDAQQLPFRTRSVDVVLLFEAIYYLRSVERFADECRRILRPGGQVLIATANKDLFDFNPSPFSFRYLGAAELHELFRARGFEVALFGSTRIAQTSLRQRLTRPAKKLAVRLGLMPKTAEGKKLLKRLVFGKLVVMPAEVAEGMATYAPPVAIPVAPDRVHKVLYCVATRSNDG